MFITAHNDYKSFDNTKAKNERQGVMCSTAHNKFHIKNELNNLKTIIWSTPPRKYEEYRSQTVMKGHYRKTGASYLNGDGQRGAGLSWGEFGGR